MRQTSYSHCGKRWINRESDAHPGCESSPSVFQQSGVDPGLLIQQLLCIPVPPVLPLWFVHFLEKNEAHSKKPDGYLNNRPTIWLHFILVYRLYQCSHSPTRPAPPSLLCLSSGRTLDPVTAQWTAHTGRLMTCGRSTLWLNMFLWLWGLWYSGH